MIDLGGLHEPMGADLCGQTWGEAVRDPYNWETDGDDDGYNHELLLDDDGFAIPDEPASSCAGLSTSSTDVAGPPSA